MRSFFNFLIIPLDGAIYLAAFRQDFHRPAFFYFFHPSFVFHVTFGQIHVCSPY
jgi:hypothetical protein